MGLHVKFNQEMKSANIKVEGECKEEKTKAQEVAEKFYACFFSGDLPGAMDCLSDDLVWTHYGPIGFLPFYGVFYGKMGFQTWLMALLETTSLADFIFQLKYYTSEGDRVHTHCLEGSIAVKTGAKFALENFHAIEVKDDKIKSFTIISETSTVINAYLKGIPGETAYKLTDYKIDAVLDINKIKKISDDIFEIIKKGKKEEIINYISDDVEIAVTGIAGTVPYINKYVGKEQAKSFIEKIYPEILEIKKDYTIACHNNKADIFTFLKGKSSTLSKGFYVPFNISFQFNKDSKVSNIYIQNDNYVTSLAYKATSVFTPGSLLKMD